MEKQLQRATFEQSKKLKQVGFNYFDNAHYVIVNNTHKLYVSNEEQEAFEPRDWNNMDDNILSAPTIALSLKWLRDEKKEMIINPPRYNGQNYQWEIIFNGIKSEAGGYEIYEQAESDILDYALNYLLQQTK